MAYPFGRAGKSPGQSILVGGDGLYACVVGACKEDQNLFIPTRCGSDPLFGSPKMSFGLFAHVNVPFTLNFFDFSKVLRCMEPKLRINRGIFFLTIKIEIHTYCKQHDQP